MNQVACVCVYGWQQVSVARVCVCVCGWHQDGVRVCGRQQVSVACVCVCVCACAGGNKVAQTRTPTWSRCSPGPANTVTSTILS